MRRCEVLRNSCYNFYHFLYLGWLKWLLSLEESQHIQAQCRIICDTALISFLSHLGAIGLFYWYWHFANFSWSPYLPFRPHKLRCIEGINTFPFWKLGHTCPLITRSSAFTFPAMLLCPFVYTSCKANYSTMTLSDLRQLTSCWTLPLRLECFTHKLLYCLLLNAAHSQCRYLTVSDSSASMQLLKKSLRSARNRQCYVFPWKNEACK